MSDQPRPDQPRPDEARADEARADEGRPLNRRTALHGTLGVAVGAPLLAACANKQEPLKRSDSTVSDDPTTEPSQTTSNTPSQAAGAQTIKTSQVPVGGCFVVAAAKAVVTQPAKGDFKAFSALCTHQGCQVSNGSGGVIPCMCHGSEFSLQDGSVVKGPATAPLPPVDFAIDQDEISLG